MNIVAPPAEIEVAQRKREEPFDLAAVLPTPHATTGDAAAPLTAESAALTPLEANWTRISAAMEVRWPAVTARDLLFLDKTRAAILALVKARTGLELDTVERQIDALLLGLRLAPA
jgi:hypothetical protein